MQMTKSKQDSIIAHQQSISQFAQWCLDNFILSVDETTELVIHTSESTAGLNYTTICSQLFKHVISFKYLGLTIDNK